MRGRQLLPGVLLGAQQPLRAARLRQILPAEEGHPVRHAQGHELRGGGFQCPSRVEQPCDVTEKTSQQQNFVSERVKTCGKILERVFFKSVSFNQCDQMRQFRAIWAIFGHPWGPVFLCFICSWGL